ncbi:MAG: antibiotic biosynthesis monooxygenase family protein [Flavobacteriaceae bacterium]
MSKARFVVVFTSSLKPNAKEYQQWGRQMKRLVCQQPGYVSHLSLRNEEGLGVTLSYWESLAAIEAWREHAEHHKAQEYGKAEAYMEYSIEVCEIKRAYSFQP